MGINNCSWTRLIQVRRRNSIEIKYFLNCSNLTLICLFYCKHKYHVKHNNNRKKRSSKIKGFIFHHLSPGNTLRNIKFLFALILIMCGFESLDLFGNVLCRSWCDDDCYITTKRGYTQMTFFSFEYNCSTLYEFHRIT